jgi:2-polyprenyl-3-methyl-5-hydroxy-6-metoxy-1,4-benzoquinol methylase
VSTIDHLIKSEGGQKAVDDHYTAFFNNADTDFRSASLIPLICGMVKPGKILDIGCGNGGLSAALIRHGNTVISQDISENMLSLTRRMLNRYNLPVSGVRLGEVQTIKEISYFDSVIALDIIEHIENDVGALKKMRESLKSNGTLVLSAPALSWLYGPKDREVGHFRRYNRKILLSVLEGAGFEIESVRFWNAVGVAPVWLSVLLDKRVNEEFRYQERSLLQSLINSILRNWLLYVENKVPFPLGLTLIAMAHPKRN